MAWPCVGFVLGVFPDKTPRHKQQVTNGPFGPVFRIATTHHPRYGVFFFFSSPRPGRRRPDHFVMHDPADATELFPERQDGERGSRGET